MFRKIAIALAACTLCAGLSLVASEGSAARFGGGGGGGGGRGGSGGSGGGRGGNKFSNEDYREAVRQPREPRW